MKNNRIYLIGLFCFIIIFILFSKVDFNGSNVKTINYTMLEFKSVDVSEAKLNRYNELINIPQVSFFVRNLSSVLQIDTINEEMSIAFCYNYANNFKDDIEKHIIKDSKNTYIDCDYTESIIYELFEKDVSLDKYKGRNQYLLVSGDNLKTDTINIYINDILYNDEYDLYKIVIKEYDHNIEIIYSYDNSKYVLLSCVEGFN